jgi:hypothetical protein
MFICPMNRRDDSGSVWGEIRLLVPGALLDATSEFSAP